MHTPLPYPRIIAHRCGGALAPENTLPGLDIAARLGCRGVEFDIMLAADGDAVMIHDETLERTTTGRGRVIDHAGDALRALDAGAGHHKAFAGTPVPAFDDALTRCKALGLWANVEIKPAVGFEVATGEIVGRRLSAWRGRGIASSFSLEALHAARAVAPRLPIAVLFERLPSDWRRQVDALHAWAVHLSARHVDAGVAAELAGIPWACYTVNGRDEAARLFGLGASAVFSDRPDLWTVEEM